MSTLEEPQVRYENLPVVVLVGRPNVGKSTLFNRLLHKRRTITDPTPGVTRDPIEEECILRGAGSLQAHDFSSDLSNHVSFAGDDAAPASGTQSSALQAQSEMRIRLVDTGGFKLEREGLDDLVDKSRTT